jgi:hypothetical protein
MVPTDMVPTDPFAAMADLPGVAAAVAAARGAVDRLIGHAVLTRNPDAVRGETALRAARANALLSGLDVDLAALRTDAVLDAGAPALLRGALRVAAELGDAAATWRRAPRQALARLHVLAAADAQPSAGLGRPESAAAAARLDLLADALAAPSTAPAVVVAAIVHGEVETCAAFGRSSGVVARAAARLVLITRGLDPVGVVAPEVGHVALGLTEYQKALDGYASGSMVGVAAWLRHCAAATGLAAAEALDVCAALAAGAGRPRVAHRRTV